MSECLPHVPALVLRFIGTTVESSSLRSLLLSVSEQINAVYGLTGENLTSGRESNAELKEIIANFQLVLSEAAKTEELKTRPLVIVLDSLDQLSNDGQPQG